MEGFPNSGLEAYCTVRVDSMGGVIGVPEARRYSKIKPRFASHSTRSHSPLGPIPLLAFHAVMSQSLPALHAAVPIPPTLRKTSVLYDIAAAEGRR